MATSVDATIEGLRSAMRNSMSGSGRGGGVSGGNGDQDKAVGAAALRAFKEKIATA